MSDKDVPGQRATPLHIRERFRLYRWIVVGFFAVALTVSVSIPLHAAEGVVSLIAGKDTNFSVGINIAIALTFGATVAVAGVGGRKLYKQGGELRRLRTREEERTRSVRRSGSKPRRGR